MYQVGEEVQFLDGTDERFGTIEAIDGENVSICGLDGTLYLTQVSNILYSLKY